jgi:hypothetical protein
MAAKTSVFYLTERLSLTASGTQATDTIDLGAYVDVADRQGILVHGVDIVWQGSDASGNATTLTESLGGNGAGQVQLTDLNRGGLVFADDRALVASGQILYGATDNNLSQAGDLYPDNFGPTSAMGGRIVINDQMYVRGVWTGSITANEAVECTVRIKCSVITLSQKDFMAIALQSTAADN